MNKAPRFIVLISIAIVGLFFMNAEKYTEERHKNNEINNDSLKNTSETYQIKALKIPEKLNFAGERVPLEKADIKERIDRELLVNTYWQSNGLLFYKRANKYFYH